MNEIGWAVKQLRNGERVERPGWNGKGMYLQLEQPSLAVSQRYVVMRTAQGDFVPWTCSQSDLLATDWMVTTATAAQRS